MTAHSKTEPDFLGGLRVVEIGGGVASAYAGKLFIDAGAEVVLVEPPDGHAFRRWSATGGGLWGNDAEIEGANGSAKDEGNDGALFRYLAASKKSVVAEPGDEALLDLLASADVLIDELAPGGLDQSDLEARFPSLVRATITPFGHTGIWSHRPATEFTVQAEGGSIGVRGRPDAEPFQAGGRTCEWAAGVTAAVGALIAVGGVRRNGRGAHIDTSLLEVTTTVTTNHMDLVFRLFGLEDIGGPGQTLETPSIEPTADGWVGFCTNARQQISDFLSMIGRQDLRDDEDWVQVAGRMGRMAEFESMVHAFTRRHTTDELIDLASAFRIPVAPVLNGETVGANVHLAERGVLVDSADATFCQPRRPYRIGDEALPTPGPVPSLGEHQEVLVAARDAAASRVSTGAPTRTSARTAPAADSSANLDLPLKGLRIVDLTTWLAGPAASHILASLGADVIHVESVSHPDGVRFVGGMFAGTFERWWECSQFFLTFDNNKRDITLDLRDPRGLDLLKRLIASADGVIENFAPRVLEGFGLDWPGVREINPRAVMVRMPAFGLTGPWRDFPGFAQNMEQMSGLAWLTGHVDDQPRIQRGPCDPIAGMHAAFAFLAALARRDATGRGQLVESTMVEAALNVAAEQIVEYSAYGKRLDRNGNRSPWAAPQGLYAPRDHTMEEPRWLALSVETDAHWEGLVAVLGRPVWAEDPALQTLEGRAREADRLDDQLSDWVAGFDRDEAVERLIAAGVPAGAVADPRKLSRHPAHEARGFYETVDHPVVGERPIAGLPFRYSGVDRWIGSPAPCLGQHNREVLCGELGVSEQEYEVLIKDGVIGDRPSKL